MGAYYDKDKFTGGRAPSGEFVLVVVRSHHCSPFFRSFVFLPFSST